MTPYLIALNFIRIGGKGVIWKGSPPEHLAVGIRVVANDDYSFSSAFENDIVSWLDSGKVQIVPKLKFSLLEKDIINSISLGLQVRRLEKN